MTDAEQHEALLTAIRKQGRAALAAQAAAESCAREVEQLRAAVTEPEGAGGAELLRALLPTLDALERVAAEARAAQPGPSSRLDRLLGRGTAPEIVALLEGVSLLSRQLEGALTSAGVERDATVGIPVDPERHRVIDVRGAAEARSRVVEVVRPGYRLGGRRLREAEVIATPETKS